MNLRPVASRRAMRGLSLIELMVSLTIGLILMVAIVSAYLGSSAATQIAQSQARMNEDGQAALAILTQHLRMAGNNPIQPNYPDTAQRNPAFDATNPYAIRGCDGTFGSMSTALIDSLTCTSGTSPDSVAVRYEADQYNTVKSGTVPTDCLGQALQPTTASVTMWDGVTTALSGTPPALHPVLAPVNVNFYVADNRFYIASLSGTPNLYCKGNGGATAYASAAQPLVENIEDLQILYRAANATGAAMTVAGYLPASGIDALATSPADTPTRWSRVMTARVCVMVRSESQVAPDVASAQYNDCSGTAVTPSDRYLHRAYSTTVVLRNRITP